MKVIPAELLAGTVQDGGHVRDVGVVSVEIVAFNAGVRRR
jgi:hypothetical protein